MIISTNSDIIISNKNLDKIFTIGKPYNRFTCRTVYLTR
jgi:hypothetical protein